MPLPARGGPVRRFYRIVGTNPPAVADFTSNAAKGFPPRGPERTDPFIYHGISLFDRESLAAGRARRFPVLGAHVAELEIPEDTPLEVRRTLAAAGHYTVVGSPALLLSFVRGIRVVKSRRG